MTKKEAIELFVNRDLQAVPQDWVRIVAEHNDEYPTLPMWGTMWIVDRDLGEKLMYNSRYMNETLDDFIDEVRTMDDGHEKESLEKAIKDEDWLILEQYIDEEMAGQHCVLDKDGNTTALFIYEIGDQYVIGVNGAGWNFYDGVWDKLYDLLGLQWHNEE